MTDPIRIGKVVVVENTIMLPYFRNTYENYNLIFYEYSIGKVCMSIEIRIIKMMQKLIKRFIILLSQTLPPTIWLDSGSSNSDGLNTNLCSYC